MRNFMIVLCLSAVLHGQAQTPEPTVAKETISVHEVERGDMPLRAMAGGSILSTEPPTASVTIQPGSEAAVKTRATASIFAAGKSVPGRVVSIDNKAANNAVTAVIRLSEPLPAGVSSGTQVGALIDIGTMHDVVFFARPATAKANTDAFQFVLEPGSSFAKRVRVHYGQQSGPLIEVSSGLAPGDRVIVTDTSAWNSSPRILIK